MNALLPWALANSSEASWVPIGTKVDQLLLNLWPHNLSANPFNDFYCKITQITVDQHIQTRGASRVTDGHECMSAEGTKVRIIVKWIKASNLVNLVESNIFAKMLQIGKSI